MFDELVFGAREAAWPLIRADLGLTYAAVGLLLSVPGVIASVVEPAFGLLADTGRRRDIILAGGVTFALALAAMAPAGGILPLMIAFAVLYPASGAFVSLSQAALMEIDPARRERNMARWVLAGSVGVVAGPLLIAGSVAAGWGWRAVFAGMAASAVPLLLAAYRRIPTSGSAHSAAHVVGSALAALRDLRVLRWLLLVELADLMGDVLTGFLALYLVDRGGFSAGGAALALAVWTGAGLAGDALLVPLLDRVHGVAILRVSALSAMVVYPAFLLASPPAARIVLLAALGALRAGWYAIPQGRLFGELPGKSGVAVALGSAAGLLGQLSPLAIGLLAQRYGLPAAMWLPMLAPLALLGGLRGAAARAPKS